MPTLTTRPEWAGWRVAVILAVAWAGLYGWRALVGHASLETNAYDLSLFDYAIWNTLHGRPGHVPLLLNHSVFSVHFMPILFVLAPIYALWQSPIFLILLQTAATAGAGLALFGLARRLGTPAVMAIALMVVFLICRRAHAAAVNYFYPECLQPLLMFSLVHAWLARRWRLMWVLALLLLGTKEDAPFYVGGFALMQWWTVPGDRPRALKLACLAAVWLVLAAGVAIPIARHLDGFSMTNPFIEDRLGSGDGVSLWAIFQRLIDRPALTTILGLLASAGFLSLAAPAWLLPAVPGVLLDLAVKTGTQQAGIDSHYAWPVLPWLFISAAAGLARLNERWPRATTVWTGALIVGTLADAPVVRNVARTHLDAEAVAVRHRLPDIGDESAIVQANLVPHFPHSNKILTLVIDRPGQVDGPANLVVLSTVGGPWPLTPAQLQARIERFANDPAYEVVERGSLWVFRRKQ